MANFLFNEGVALAMGPGLDWVGTSWSLSIYETPLLPAIDMVWADVAAFVVDTQEMPSREITSFAAARSGNVTFTAVTASENEYIYGILIHRTSDNVLLSHMDTGFEGFTNALVAGVPQLGATNIEYTFTVRPGDNNERAWFRL